jgi:N-acetylglucosaminyldiphosphoundecaprenol N-acetyl-beta-D-mannosaminyltransferase
MMTTENQNEHRENKTDAIPSISLLGVKVHRVDMAAALDAIRHFLASGKPHIIVTADASGIVRAQKDADFRNLVNNADLVTPDGSGVLKGAAMLGTPLIERVSGVEIAREMCRMSAEDGSAIYFLGAAPGVAEQAAANLKEQFPGLKIAGTHDGYFDQSQDAEIAAEVKASGAQALLVAMGIPRQEKFIRDNMDKLGVCVAMGVGGSFDVFSGKVKRAPEFFQRHGLEWLYRLAKDPKKISKVSSLPRFVWLVLREKFSIAKARK